MHSLVCRPILDQDLLILLSSYCGWSLTIVVWSSLVIHLIHSNMLYLRTCPNLMTKSLTQLFIRFWFDKGFFGIMHCVAPSKVGSLFDATLKALGFFVQKLEDLENPYTFFRKFLAALTQANTSFQGKVEFITHYLPHNDA